MEAMPDVCSLGPLIVSLAALFQTAVHKPAVFRVVTTAMCDEVQFLVIVAQP
jgi:hypothetical protein